MQVSASKFEELNEKGTFYDLFAGIGGFRLGLERAGFHCVGSCEIDKDARKIYGKNFGQEPEASNALKLDAGTMPDFDILAAGFPCQAFSTAGKRLGFEDTRGTLFFEIARIAREKRPAILFLENVTGLLSHDDGRTFATILRTLHEMGYDAEWQVINGKYFLPQSRERVFIIGHLRGKASKQVFPVGENETMAGEGPDSPSVKTLTGGAHSGGLHSQMTVIAESAVIHSPPRGLETRVDGISHCIKGGEGGGSKIHVKLGDKVRRLTPLECERLQGFPDGWTEGVSDTARYRLLGNAVMPPVIEYIATHFQIQS